MKKNFLFLLMMLAPVFAWAQTDFSTGTVTIPDFTYQGTGTEDAIVVKFDGAALTKTTDYTITAFEVFDVEADAWAAVATPRHAGKFRATVVGDGVNYTGTETVEFTVKQAGITVNLLGATKTYGEPLDSKYVTYSLYGDLKAGDDEDNVSIIFEIPLKDGKEDVGVHPYSEIDLEGITAETDDYLVGVNVATSAKVTVVAKNISAYPAWTIDVIDPVTFKGSEYRNEQGITVVVRNGAGEVVAEDGNFTIGYFNNVDAGTATVKVEGDGNYTGFITWDFIINPLTVTAADITIADIDPYTYAKVAYEPTPQVTDQLGNVMRVPQDFTWAWADNTNASEEAKAKAQIVKVAGSNYTFEGTELVVTKNFTINPLAIATAKGAFDPAFTMANDTKVYTGLPLTTSEVLKWTHGDPEVTDDLAEGTDYEIDYKEKNTNVGNCYFDIVGKGNFTGTVTGKRRLRIDPRDISEAEVTITFDAASYPYAGGPQTPSFTVVDSKSGSDVTLVEGTDYTIKEWKNNKNVYDGVNKGTVVIEGKGNYAETNEQYFEITKATLKIQPKADQAKFIGSLDPELTWEFAEGYGLQGEDEGKEAEILSELPVVTRDAGDGLGNYELHISNIASITADPNYDVVEVTGVTFAIVPTKLFIRVKEGLEKYYGATVPAADAYAEYFTVNGLLGTDAVDDVTFTLKDKDGNDLATPLAAGDAIPFGEYTIAATAATVSPNPTKYDVIFEADYNLTVGKKPVVVAIDDAAKDYGDADPALTYTDPGTLEYGETLASLGLTPVLTREEGEAVGTYEITGTLEADNYVFTFTPATFTINPTTFALNRVPKADFENAAENTAAKLVNDYDGVPVDVKFSMYNLVGDPAVKEEQEFKAEKWYTLVLPFETSVAEVSAAFGYAVVNKFVGKTDDDLVKFRLHMQDLPANEPFIVKIYQDMKLSDVVAFTGKTIVKPATVNENADPYVEIDDIRFIGTYKGKTDGFRANEWYFSFDEKYGDYYSGNETNKTYLRPLGAYLQAQPGVEVRGIEVQDRDGSILVDYINGVNADENSNDNWYSIDGKKMQKPATKGVYIQNGKKVVIK